MESSADWISKLPDCVLCHILSFLSTKDSVRTSVLSKRWQYLWTCVTTLDFSDSCLSNAGEAEVKWTFMNFVNRVLILTDASLKKISLSVGGFPNLDLINTWISAAIKRIVHELKVITHCVGLDYYNYIMNPVQLPRTFFTSKTVVNLVLSGRLFLKIPASVWLPNLKSIVLGEIVYENEESAQKLFSGCPVLENLYIMSHIHQVLNISVLMLKRLTVIRLGDYPDQFSDSHIPSCKLVVDAPKLECLQLTDYLADDFSLENLSSLSEARLSVGLCCAGPDKYTDYNGRIFKLLCGIATVKSLDFFTEVKGYALPTFCNLTHLRLGAASPYAYGNASWNLDLLKEFLQYSPNLEVLILEENRVLGSAECWIPPMQVPPCLLLHLKEIQIQKFNGKEYVRPVIEYLLKNAEVLEKMTIDCRYSVCCFSGELTGYPRGSEACQLNLLF